MSERIEKIIKEYPKRKRELKCLENQIKRFTGLSEEEVIDSLYFNSPEGERVQTSSISQKTASIALSYRNKTEEINWEWYRHLRKQYLSLYEELTFFESALKSLSGELPSFMTDMVINGYTWDELSTRYHVSHTMIGKYRRKAIRELDILYKSHDAELAAYLLS